MKKTSVLSAERLFMQSADVRKTISLPSIILSAVIILAGIISLFLSSRLDDTSSALYMAMVTSAFVLFVVSVYRFLTASRHIVYVPTGSPIRKYFCYFESDELQRVAAALQSSDITALSRVAKKFGGNVRLDYFVSADSNFCAVQLFQYVPYTYEPVTQVIFFRNEDAKTLSAYLKRK